VATRFVGTDSFPSVIGKQNAFHRKQRWKIWAGISFGLGLLALIFCFWLFPTDGEPVYDGKPLDIWVIGYRSPEPEQIEKAREIIHRVGTNAIPSLRRMLEARDSSLRRSILTFLQTKSGYRIQYFSPEIRKCAAANACAELGSNTKPLVSILIQLSKDDDANVQNASRDALGRIYPESIFGAQPRSVQEKQIEMLQSEITALQAEEQVLIRALESLGSLIKNDGPEYQDKLKAAREKIYPPKQQILDLTTSRDGLIKHREVLEKELKAYKEILSGPY
jgi:hypothetical protein